MTREEIEAAVRAEIEEVAPDAELIGLDPEADIRDALDLDSMDVMNIIVALHARLGAEIPDADVPQLLTLNGAVDYLSAKLG